MKKTFLAAMALIMSFSTFAGTNSGGGGGTYLADNGQLVTLPEFGILIEDKQEKINPANLRSKQYYSISNETRNELKKITDKLQKTIVGIKLPNFIIPERKKLISDLNPNPELYKKIKEEYRSVLEAFGYKLEDNRFILPALSIGDVTFIFPDFEKLSPYQQAKILIHEANMREGLIANENGAELLAKVLKIDTVIERILKTDKNDSDFFSIMKSLTSLKMLEISDVLANILQLMSEELGHELTEADLRAITSVDYYTILRFEPHIIEDFQMEHNLKRDYAEMLGGTTMDTTSIQQSKEKCNPETDGIIKVDSDTNKLLFLKCNVTKALQNKYYIQVLEKGSYLKQFLN